MTKTYLSILVAIILTSASATAHEYWLEPESFFLKAGEKTKVHLYVGDGLIKDREEKAYQPEKTVTFQLFSIAGLVDLKPAVVAGAMPMFEFPDSKAGSHLLAMERNWSYIKLDADKFEEYLREDGMEHVIAERKKLGESKKEGRERYARFIKSLVLVGDKPDNTFATKIGSKMEIVPLDNPYSKKVGGQLRFQILFNGKPLPNRTVFADNRDAPTQTMKTDKNGTVRMTITHAGMWIIRLVDMQRCKTDCAEADWESFWAAFTFGSRE